MSKCRRYLDKCREGHLLCWGRLYLLYQDKELGLHLTANGKVLEGVRQRTGHNQNAILDNFDFSVKNDPGILRQNANFT